MTLAWPPSFRRIPDDDWTHHPVETLALKYDSVENHGWYRNLDRTLEQLDGYLRDGHLLVDYSGGTGILADRLLHRVQNRGIGIAIVDASPKFLRLALEKLRAEPRVAFRHIRYLKDKRRLEFLDEVLDLQADAIVSTNAIHLYYDLPDTLKSWVRVLRPGALAFVQSGNIRNPRAPAGEWIIDETVEAIHARAAEIVRADPVFAAYRPVLGDAARMAQYDALRSKFFLPVRPLEHYLGALCNAGFSILDVARETVEARVSEWYQFLAVYHEGVLGWVGGSEKVEGRPPEEAAVRDRLALMKEAMYRLFDGRDAFACCWTYITART
jgi:ubiquinone/menaquinone biosynthesis C-methylase UbiE